MNKYYNETLQLGSQGDGVKEWQTFLNTQGYNLSVDGDFGDNTLAATKAYQKANGLYDDGIVGAKTWGKAGYSAVPSSTFEYDDFQVDGGNEDGEYNTANSNKTAAQGKLDALGDFNNSSYYGEITKSDDGKLMIDKIMQDILNMKDFSYDLNGDALYQQYKDKYIQQGKLAMQDTMGQASAMTGGYGNSNAIAAGNQAYQAQLQNLNDIVPELYQMAYDRYNQGKQDLYNQYGLLSDEYDKAYGMYNDEYNRLYGEREYWGNEENNIYNRQYGEYSDDKAYAYQDHRDAVADYQWQKTYDLSKASASSGGSGGGGGASNLTAAQWGEIVDNCEMYADNPNKLESYINGLVNRGYISADEAADLFGKYGSKEEEIDTTVGATKTVSKGTITAPRALGGGLAAAFLEPKILKK